MCICAQNKKYIFLTQIKVDFLVFGYSPVRKDKEMMNEITKEGKEL
jgi:hypothetical protein